MFHLFATIKGISGCKDTEALIAERGFQYWVQMIELCPRAQLIVAFGAHARKIRIQQRFGIKWQSIPTGFDRVGKVRFKRDDFAFTRLVLPKTHRKVLIYWWTPTCKSPLCRLTDDRKRQLGE